ncbi:MAG TPA: ABC transporter permease [Acidobacteriota bacterium]|nr:ABC transporter permease [Acidobacteriota bacterium]
MKQSGLLLRNLSYYRRTNIPVIAGVALAVAVLSGALLVGQSVRASLRRLLYERIGTTESLVTAEHFFGEKLAASLNSDIDSCPIIYLKGVVIREETGVRMHEVNVYGIDNRFWKFQGVDVPAFPDDRAAYVGEPLAGQLNIRKEDGLLLRVDTPEAIPREWLYGRRDSGGRTLRLRCRRILSAGQMGEFALRPSQGNIHSIFVPMKRLQKDLSQQAQINAILLARPQKVQTLASVSDLLKDHCALQDLNLRFQAFASGKGFSLESAGIILDGQSAEAAIQTAASMGMEASPVYTYLANSIRANGREVPYSVITAADFGKGALRSVKEMQPSSASPALKPSNESIWLTEWTQHELGATSGEPVDIDYYVWQQEGKLETRTARFRMAGVLADSPDIDATLAPHIPGVTDAKSMNAWDPPFPLDLGKIRPADEKYWHRYKTTPKAFVTLAKGQELWQSRFGNLTALRIALPDGEDLQAAEKQFSESILHRLNPQSAGFVFTPLRDLGVAASQGTTDFGEYFVYFSFFLIAAAILLAALFFRLMIEQRVKEIGVLRACGFSTGLVQRNFFYEGALLSVAGSLLGLLGSVVYGWLMIFGLRTWWTDSVGTRHISLHISWTVLLIGCTCGIVFSIASLAWTLRTLRHNSIRLLLTGALESITIRTRRVRILAITSFVTAIVAFVLPALSAWGKISQLLGFFGAGFFLLMAILCATALYLRRAHPAPVGGHGWPAYIKLGLRNATHRPARSLFCASLIAAAAFIVISTEAFRQDAQGVSLQPDSGTGGFPLLAESTLPILYDLNSASGQEAIGLSPEQQQAFQQVHFIPFRKRPGDDASCLNLYAPQEPEIIGAPKSFSDAGRFSFQNSLASTPEQRKNPWLLLDAFGQKPFIPAIADANTLQYILHIPLGNELVIRDQKGKPVRLRFVAALRDSVFQGKLIISEADFLRAFPEQEGHRLFLLDMSPSSAPALTPLLQEGLSDYGFAVESTQQRLAAYHRVENTYLSTFQSLGTLGLILGTAGLAIILLRNVLERMPELALLRAVGFRSKVVSIIILAENAFLILWGLAAGVCCAFIAILPAIHARSVPLPFAKAGLIMLLVLAAGLASSLVAVIASHRTPLVAALRSE